MVFEVSRVTQPGKSISLPVLGDDCIVMLPGMVEQEPNRRPCLRPQITDFSNDICRLVVDHDLPPVHLSKAVDVDEIPPGVADFEVQELVYVAVASLDQLSVEGMLDGVRKEIVRALLPYGDLLVDLPIDV